MDGRQARKLARAFAWVRMGIGGLLVVLPAAAGPFLGKEESRRTGSQVLARGLGARDIALGTGVLLALRHDAPVRGWLEAGGLADAGDALGMLLAFGRLPRRLRWPLLAAAASAVVMARVLSAKVDGA